MDWIQNENKIEVEVLDGHLLSGSLSDKASLG